MAVTKTTASTSPQNHTAVSRFAALFQSDKELAADLGHVDTRVLQDWARKGFGPPRIKLGKRVFYRRSSVLAFMRSLERRSRPCRTIRASDADSKGQPKSRTHRGVSRPSARRMSKAAR